MNLFDRFVVGTFSAFICIATGFILSAIIATAITPLEIIGPVFNASLVMASLIFILGFAGKISLVTNILSVFWKPIQLLFKWLS